MKKIDREKFIDNLLDKFNYIKSVKYEYCHNCYYIEKLDNDDTIAVIEFIGATSKNLYSIYINVFQDDNINNYIVDYFKGIKLDNKNFIISDIKNNNHIIK